MDAILTLADATKPWRPLVEAAYAKLSQPEKRKARFTMLSFYASVHDNQAAYRFIPRRFVGPFTPVELAFAIETLVALNKLDEARPVVRKAVRLLDSLATAEGRAMLKSSIATYLSQVHQWEEAIHLWEGLLQDRLMAESAILDLLALHLRRTLATIRSARKALDHLRQNPDPALETTIPGNEAACWRDAEEKLSQVERRVLQALTATASPPDRAAPAGKNQN
jgi:hypothetical protein